MKQQLSKLDAISDYNFAEKKDGIVTHIATKLEIPNCNIIERIGQGDGFYIIYAHTCEDDSGCEIGSPAERCIEQGCYNSRQCAKYQLEPITDDIKLYINLMKLNEVIGVT